MAVAFPPLVLVPILQNPSPGTSARAKQYSTKIHPVAGREGILKMVVVLYPS